MISKEQEELLKYYNLGLSAYRQKKWDEAISAFEMALEFYPEDGPSGLYLDRAKKYKEVPPSDDWDGVFVMDTK